jgi:hypothetical protein
MRHLTLVEVKKAVHCSEHYGLTGEDPWLFVLRVLRPNLRRAHGYLHMFLDSKDLPGSLFRWLFTKVASIEILHSVKPMHVSSIVQ